MTAEEINFDGIVGPTHNYSGLSYGNIASIEHKSMTSSPKQAALQGLDKMKFLADLGIKQAVLPPHNRPHIPTLHRLGFTGSPEQVIAKASKEDRDLFWACCSAAPMWTANSAIVSPSSDTANGRVHFTPANLSSKFHRSLEHQTTGRVLQAIFPSPLYFTHHPALPPGKHLACEGAANHLRFCHEYGGMGVEMFVWGAYGLRQNTLASKNFPARQTFEASEATARIHGLYPERTIFAQQSPTAIDAGVFHNDVASVNNGNLFLFHEQAFVGMATVLQEIEEKVKRYCDTEIHLIKVPTQSVSIADAVQSYLFNSQIVTLPNQSIVMIVPTECQEVPSVSEFLEDLLQSPENPIIDIHYLPLRQSMRNGGGPACLRLRVVLNEKELDATNPNVFLTDKLYQQLKEWIETYYRDELTPHDLADPQFYHTNEEALDALSRLLNLGNIYDFQQ